MNLGNFDLRNLRQRDIALIMIGLSVVVAALWWFFLYQPTQDRIAQLQERADAAVREKESKKTASRFKSTEEKNRVLEESNHQLTKDLVDLRRELRSTKSEYNRLIKKKRDRKKKGDE